MLVSSGHRYLAPRSPERKPKGSKSKQPHRPRCGLGHCRSQRHRFAVQKVIKYDEIDAACWIVVGTATPKSHAPTRPNVWPHIFRQCPCCAFCEEPGLTRIQPCTDSEVILPAAMAGGNTGLVLCQVGGQCSGQ